MVDKVRMDGGVTRDRLLRLSAKQLVNGNVEGSGNQVVQGQVHSGHGHVGNSTQPVRQGRAVHLIPDQLDVERILPDKKPAKMLVDHRTGKCTPAVVHAGTGHALVGLDLDRVGILARPHPKGAHLRVLRMDRHRVGNERTGLPASAPILRLPLSRAARPRVPGLDRVKFKTCDLHRYEKLAPPTADWPRIWILILRH